MKNNRYIKPILGFIADLSIKTKLLFSFILFSLILVLGVGILSYQRSSSIIDKQTVTYSESILEQIKDRVDEMRDQVLKVSIPIVIKPSIQNNDLQSLNLIDFTHNQFDIYSQLTLTMFLKKYICSIYICNENGFVISSENVSEADKMKFKDFGIYKSTISNGTKPIWIGARQNEFSLDKNKLVFSFVRTLYSKETFIPFGVLIINVPVSVLDDICGNSKNNNIYIIDKYGNIIYEKGYIGNKNSMKSTYLKQIIKSKSGSGTFNWGRGSKSLKIQYISSENGDWIYIAEIPMNYLLQNSSEVKKSIYVILIIGIIMSIGAAFLISSYITVPLRRMTRTMKKVQKGDFNINLDINNKSEIGQLAESYKLMVKELNELIEEIKLESRKKREAELNALQAQITPHFLYNTLNSIKCMARIQKISGIEEMTGALIGLLQLSISRKSTFIKISEEIDIVKKYVLLRNYKSGNNFNVEYEYEEADLEYMTIKMSLQPIIENSIIHGLEPKNGQGKIHIKIFKENDKICFEIVDNGVGMSAMQLEKILQEENNSDRRFSGIGIKNINERISMYFGNEFGITFESLLGEYTKVILKIPAIRESEVENYV